MTATPSVKAIIDRILKRFSDPATPDLAQFVSGVNEAGEQGAIDDGRYGDPSRDERPDFIQKDNTGWQDLRR